MRKKIIAAALCVCMTAGTITGCMGIGNKEKQQENTKEEKAEQGSGGAESQEGKSEDIDYNASFELRFTSSLNGEVRTALLEEAAQKLNEKWPNVTVVNESTGDYAQKLKLEFSSGDGYDMVYLDDLNQQALMENNYLMDITDDVLERGWIDKSVPGSIEFNNLRTPDKYYSASFLMAPIVVYYNKDIFKEIGAEVPKTVEELEVIMQKAKEAGYIPTECGGDNYYQIIWAAESMILNSAPKDDIDDWYYKRTFSENMKKAFTDAFARISDWHKKGYYRENFEGVKGDDVPALFSQGKTAFTIDGDWSLANFEASGLNMGAFIFPGFSADSEPYIVDATDGAWALNANLDTNKKAAALDWIDIFFEDDFVKKWYEASFTPATLTDVSDVEATDLHKEVAESTKNAKIGFYLDNVKPGYLDYMIKETQLLTQGQHTPESLCESLEKEWDKK